MGSRKAKSIKLIHVSFDLVDKFTPRVPEFRCPGEDAAIPRICAAHDVLYGINSMPAGGYCVKRMLDLGLPPIVHAYYMTCGDVMLESDVARYVPDAEASGESWLLREPGSVRRVDYRLDDIDIIPREPGVSRLPVYMVLYARLSRVPFADNWDSLLCWLGMHPGSDSMTHCKNDIRTLTSFRTFITNFNNDELAEIRRMLADQQRT